MLKQIVYISLAVDPMKKAHLEQILKECVDFNLPNNITGFLIFVEGSFLQVLEGEEEKVNEIFEKIKKDERHNQVVQLLDEEIEKREFDRWEMSFRVVSKEEIKSFGHFIHLDQVKLEEDFRKFGGKTLLKSFYDINVKTKNKYWFG